MVQLGATASRGAPRVSLWSLVTQEHGRLVQGVLAFCLFEAAFYFAYRYGMSFSQALASPFWFPDSVLLCALLLTGRGLWPIFLLGALPIRLFSEVAHDIPLWFLLATYAIDSARGVLTALVLRRVMRNAVRFESVQEFAAFCLWAVLLTPAASAFAGAFARQALGHEFWSAWEQWFLGNALTHLVVTPVILYWVFGASGAVAIIALLSVEAALEGRGPFSGQSPAGAALALQHFLLLRAAPLYLIAILRDRK